MSCFGVLPTSSAHFSTRSAEELEPGAPFSVPGRNAWCFSDSPRIMLMRLPYLASNCRMLDESLWYRATQIAWLLGISCLCLSTYSATSSGVCWSKNLIGHLDMGHRAVDDLAEPAWLESLSFFSALIGSISCPHASWSWESKASSTRLMAPFSEALLLIFAKGHRRLPCVPFVVKSFSRRAGAPALVATTHGFGYVSKLSSGGRGTDW
jgi:hypothetical protein